jgi:hypothetical protein
VAWRERVIASPGIEEKRTEQWPTCYLLLGSHQFLPSCFLGVSINIGRWYFSGFLFQVR